MTESLRVVWGRTHTLWYDTLDWHAVWRLKLSTVPLVNSIGLPFAHGLYVRYYDLVRDMAPHNYVRTAHGTM